MKSATYSNTAVPKEKFAENLTYDKMGNITSIKRDGLIGQDTYGAIDDLTFGYTGNQLNYITDAGPNVSLSASADFKDYSKLTTAEYTFNKNGAMTKDLNKGIQGILYNSLNLPQEMVISHVTARAKNYYTYTATGTKLRVIHKSDPALNGKPELGSTATDASLTTSITTDYVGNKIYEAGTLKTILTDNGYIEGNTYYFYIKDHLGNNRIVANASASVVQSNQYYPFGMAFAEGTTTEQGKQEFKYNGKELDRSHELNQYDYSARFYDPGYNRFTTPDPLSEKLYNWSPYVYCYNNPMSFIDPDGRFPWFIPVVIAVLWANSTPAMAPTTQDPVLEGQRQQEAYDDYNSNVISTIIPVPGGAATGKVGMSLGAQVGKEVGKQVEKAVVKEVKEEISNQVEKTYQTYTKPNLNGGKDYTGRTGGKGTPEQNVANRDKGHHKNKEGYGPATLDQTSKNPKAIRGREQQMIDKNGGVKSQGGTSGNSINGVSPKNPNAKKYNDAALKEFGTP